MSKAAADRAGEGGAKREWPWAALALAFVAAPALFWGGQVAFDETLSFVLRRYWSDRSFLEIVFDPRGWDFYQARELSYAVDLLDAQWVRLLLSRGLVLLLPPSAVLASLAVVLIGLRLAPRALPQLGGATRWLVLLVFLSNFVFLSTMGWLCRATKPLVAPLLLGLLLLVVAEHRDPRLRPRAGFAAVLGTALAMSLLDRQGFFYVLALAGSLGLAWIRTRRGLSLAVGALVAAAVWTAYNYAVGPWIIHSVNGYWPEFRFQRLRPGRLMQAHPWFAAVDLLGDWTSVLLGGLPPLALAAAAATAGAAWAWSARREKERLALGLAVAAAGLAGQVAMVAIMVQRHEPVTWADHRLWYYPLPYQALVVFLLLWGLDRRAARRAGPLTGTVPIALAGLAVANVAQWPEKLFVMQTEPAFAEELRSSLVLARSFEDGHAGASLAGDHRRFYFECLDRFPPIAARARPQVSEGEGVLRPEVRGGRLVAWAGREARLVARTRTAGRFVLAGRVRLRPGDALSVVSGSPPRLLAEVPRVGASEGDEGFRVTVDLPAGTSEIRLRSSLPERPVPDEPQGAAFALLLPALLWPEPADALSPRAPSAIVPRGRTRGRLTAERTPPVTPDSGFNGTRRVPPPVNEPVKAYAPGSPERAELKARLKAMAGERIEIPLVIGGKEVRSAETAKAIMPHDHAHVLAEWHKAQKDHVARAIEAAATARREWASWPWEDRAAVFLRAAELLTTGWRATLNAATMLGQSKTAFQAEIDSAAELIDFWRFNPHYAQELYAEQPLSNGTMWNQLDYRPLEGFVYAVTPFNFTSIAGNLPTSPALMGNTVLWKPASSAVPSAHCILKLLEAAGLPPGVINLLPGNASAISDVVLNHPDLAGVHFTGSTEVFNSMWKTIGADLSRYRSYPRIVGETGGKDFMVAHASADLQAFSVAVVRGGYEYQGQKCSAASRIYVPRSTWGDVRDRLVAMIGEILMGDVQDFRNFMGAVIDKKAFDSISAYVGVAKKTAKVLAGGGTNLERGYFIEPTLVQVEDPGHRLLCEEIFGPVVTVYVYDDARWEDTLRLVDETSPYALTGAVFANDRAAIRQAAATLRGAAGNFYVNDKPTGAVVGQQPFGGARASGTNDKAGSKLNLVRWVSARAVKEAFNPPRDYRYPFMAEE